MAIKRKRSASLTNEATAESPSKVNGTSRSSKRKSRSSNAAPQSDWINFKIRYHQARKGKKGQAKSTPSNGTFSQPHPYVEGEEQVYEVLPRTWDRLMRYKKFRLMDETSDSMRVGDVVLVNNDKGAETDGDVDIFSQWKAHVLEIRAPDAQHVYLRVLWVYDPEELPGGRRSYHGENELVPSNDMAIIDAMTINGLVSLKKWNEYDDDDDPDTGTDEAPGFYWRQTYDVNKRQLSQLRKHCICNLPANPDNLLVQCTNKATCGRWLHSECIKTEAIKKATAKAESNADPASSPLTKQGLASEMPKKSIVTPNKGKKRMAISTEHSEQAFAAEVMATPGKRGHRLMMQDLRDGHKGEAWKERIYCLSCNSLLIDEGETQPEDAVGIKMEGATHDETASADEITVRGGDVKPIAIAPETLSSKNPSLKDAEASVKKEDDASVKNEDDSEQKTTVNGEVASTFA